MLFAKRVVVVQQFVYIQKYAKPARIVTGPQYVCTAKSSHDVKSVGIQNLVHMEALELNVQFVIQKESFCVCTKDLKMIAQYAILRIRCCVRKS